jgi:uncharacterized protein YigA (DUF484 family)
MDVVFESVSRPMTAPKEQPPAVANPEWEALRPQVLAQAEALRGDPEALAQLGLRVIAHNVVEFLPAALARLEAAHAREQSARQAVEDMAAANFAAQSETHGLSLDLLESRNNADLARRVDEAARGKFGLLGAMLGVEPGEDATVTPIGWKALPAGAVDRMLGPHEGWRLGPCPEAGELFGEAALSVKSAALIRLSLWAPERAGLLAFASGEADGFTPCMGADLVAFLGRVVERVASRWPLL